MASDKKCRILMLRGGGIHGSYEAGVLKSIVEQMPAEDIKYDYVSGVSIGAINASIFALFAPGEEKEAAELIVKSYDGQASSDAYDAYSPLIFAPFMHDSMTDNTKFVERLENLMVDKPFKRKLSILSADMLTA